MRNKQELRIKRHRRIRLKIRGTQERPRLSVHRSLKNLTVHIIDDTQNRIIFSMSTLDKEVRQKFPNSGNAKAAAFFAEVLARRVKEKGISKVVLDRCGYLYHGRIKAFAESLRKGGLEF